MEKATVTDAYASTGQGFLGYNMFAYCYNNPVVYADDGGEDPTIIIEQGLELFQQFLVWWNSGGDQVVSEAVLYLLGIASAYAITANINEAKSKTKSAASNATPKPVTSTPAPPPNNNNNNKNNHDKRDFIKAKTNKIANEWAIRAGYNSAEAFKREFVWNQGSRFDMYYDRIAKMLLLIEKATGQIIRTGVDFIR